MPDITIDDVPDPVIRNLERNVARSRQTLQAYLLDLVTREAERETAAEVMSRQVLDASTSRRDERPARHDR
jgi:hypothetical protein